MQYRDRTPDRTHVPELEEFAFNQMPKTRDHTEPKLYRYEGTNLYQWFSRVDGSVFHDAFAEPFIIETVRGSRPTFEYEKLGQRDCHFETEQERQDAIETLISDLRSYFSEGYEGDGDGWSPRTWEETNRLGNIVFAVRDLRWKRDADGQGGVNILLAPRAIGQLYHQFVPHEPRDLPNGSEIERQLSEEKRLEWINEVLRSGSLLIETGDRVTSQGQRALADILSARKQFSEAKDAFNRLQMDIMGSADPLEAQKFFRIWSKGRTVGDQEKKVVIATIGEKFYDLWRHQLANLRKLIAAYSADDKSEPELVTLAELIKQTILVLQTKYGYLPFTKERNEFAEIGRLRRNKKMVEQGIPKGTWHKHHYPNVDPYALAGGGNLLDDEA